MSADTTTKTEIPKPWTAAAKLALKSWVGDSQKAVEKSAISISKDESILASDVHLAIERFETARGVYARSSDWAKWVAFFAGGIFVPNLIALLNAENADKSTIWWTVGPIIGGVALITYSAVTDWITSRPKKNRRR